jgi:hypothetical protein
MRHERSGEPTPKHYEIKSLHFAEALKDTTASWECRERITVVYTIGDV